MPKSRLSYPPEFRREAVAMVRSGRKGSEVSETLGMTEQSVAVSLRCLSVPGVGLGVGAVADDRGLALAAADAQRGDAAPGVASSHLVQKGD
jgi:transposase-like protein